MKTLNEVIKALECCCEVGLCETECPYHNDCGNDEEKVDALNYLKAYRDDRDDLTALRAFWKEQQKNDPLTWDEIRQMEGKPVWVEEIGHEYIAKYWSIHHGISDGYDGDEILYLQPFTTLSKNSMGKTWQAYRKERS